MKRKGLMRITAVFFGLMICFTILSRAAYQEGTALVHTGRPSSMVISHQVKTTGKVEQNQELAVTTEPNLRVASIEVGEGDRVSRGDLLFTLDLTMLEEKILNQKQEMEKQQLNVEDAKSQKDVSRQQKANEQAQASENYSLNTNRAGVALSRAARNLNQAREELKEFRKNSGREEGDDTVEAALEADLEEKTQAYVDAVQELDSLKWQIENAVYQALQAAQGGTASLESRQTVLTGAEDLLLEEAPQPAASFQAETQPQPAASSQPETQPQPAAGSQPETQPQPETSSQPETEKSETGPAETQDSLLEEESPGNLSDAAPEEYDPDILLEEEPILQETGETVWEPEIQEEPWTENPALPETEQTEGETVSGAPPTEEELNRLEQSVRDGYRERLEAAQNAAAAALEEKNRACEALARYQQERLAAESAAEAQTEQGLLDALQAARDAYVDASIAANEAAVTSGRAVAAAGIPQASNSSDRVNEITYEQMELQLEKLETLLENQGRVCAPADGLVTGIYIQTGGMTAETTAVLLADLSKGYRFVGEITREQEKYIGAGDLVTLTANTGRESFEELPVSAVRADEEKEGVYTVTVQLPEDTLELGAAAALDFTKKSEVYPICVPLSALYLDEKNLPYVLVLDEIDTIMGTETRARKVSVTVLEQNESFAALAEGAVGSQEEVIVSSDKSVDDGSRVRLAS
ncbi:MAG TPA: hypothetical protein IAC80_01645 [Candidatus Merdiplasma excrementigallinarum]|uniref:Membrane fusion protein biotin-lipoyl like domain-containing protein n=1 Tax=Candidatus Merdiplasma excrementigallinarum TaxID=2840864 RepID=A0A9D1NXH3_9FIRM|nr:hypothetical protein [Candidatus Merdiplasma excrementigallinarum]